MFSLPLTCSQLVHQLLTLYATGASTHDLQKAFDANKTYQLKAMRPREELVQAMQKDWASGARDSIGKGRQYATFLRFFQTEIERVGWKQVLLEYLFKDDERGRDLQSRLFGGLLHPLIQLSYGLEFGQPAVVAEAMAQVAVHSNSLHAYLTGCHDVAAARPDAEPMGSVLDFYTEVAENEKLRESARWKDIENPFYGILCNALDDMVELGSRVRVRPDELDERTAEMMHACTYIAAAAAFHPPHVPKFDFFLMYVPPPPPYSPLQTLISTSHQLTAAPFFLTINAQPWIPTPVKTRLLESKIRIDFLQYLARGCPRLHPSMLSSYTPTDASLLEARTVEDVLPRLHGVVDDGHTIKVARAAVLARKAAEGREGRGWMKFKREEDWVRILWLLVDANEGWGVKWVRGAGFEEAWEGVPRLE